MDMEPLSFGHLILNNPEWVAALASIVFAIITIAVLIWQGCVMKAQVRVMKWQGRTSARHEQTQNQLIRLQHEHEWVRQRNQEREEILQSARKLHDAVGFFAEETFSTLEPNMWIEVLDTARDLNARLSILDVATFTGDCDQWFPQLEGYVEAVQKIAIKEPNLQYPSPETRTKLKEADKLHNPVRICLEIEAAIRMEFFDFKKKWDDLLS